MYKDWDMNKSLSHSLEKPTSKILSSLYTSGGQYAPYALKDYEKACEKYLSLTRTNMRSANLFLYAAQCKRMARPIRDRYWRCKTVLWHVSANLI